MEILLSIITISLGLFMITGMVALVVDTTGEVIRNYKHNKNMKQVWKQTN